MDKKDKTYSKLIICGQVIYWYEYDKPPTKMRPEKSQMDAYDVLDMETTKLSQDYFEECRKDERRSQTLRDGSNLVKQIAQLNFFPEDSTFLTQTFADHVTDIYYSDYEFEKFIKRLRYQTEEPDLKYLAVRELTKKGRIHYHVLVNSRLGLPPLPVGYARYKGDNGKTYNNSIAHQYELEHVYSKEKQIGDIWKHGIVDVKPLYSEIDNIGAYLVKYMTKTIALDLFPGKNFYLLSNGLRRPDVIAGDMADQLIESLGLRQKKEVFSNSYITEYQDMCHFKEINLQRLTLPV